MQLKYVRDKTSSICITYTLRHVRATIAALNKQ